KLIVNATTQQTFVGGYQSADTEAADTIWREIWQSNRWDKRQIPLHKSTAAYGLAYAAILPAADDDAPHVIRPLSARRMTAADDADTIWREIWQSNRSDKRQIPRHKSTAAYGVAYGAIRPAADDDAPPVIRPLSARRMTAAYGDDDEWPEYALEQRKDGTWWL